MNTIRMLAASASTLALTTLSAPVLAQTTVVVGAPEGSAPGAVGGTALAAGSRTVLGTNGRLIFNHNDDSQDGYVIDPTAQIYGSSGSSIDLIAGTTTFTANAPYKGTPSALGETVVTPPLPTSNFQGRVSVYKGATLQLAAQYGLRQVWEGGTYPVGGYVVRPTGKFGNTIFYVDRLNIQQGGRLTGQGNIQPASLTSTGDLIVIAGVVSPHGFPERGGAYDAAHGEMTFGNQSLKGNLVFTSTSVLEMDVDLALANDGKVRESDIIRTDMNTRIEDGAQIRLRLAQSSGTTSYLPGRTVYLLGMNYGYMPEAHKHVYQLDYSTVDLSKIDWSSPPAWLNPQYVEIGSVAAPKAGDKLVVDGHTYLYRNDINQATRGVTGTFTLTSDSQTQLTHYLGLELKKGVASVKAYGDTKTVETSVYLEVVQNRQFTEDAKSVNAAAAAAALQTIGVYNPMFVRLLNLRDDSSAITNGELPAFFDALSGGLHVGVRGLMTQDAYQIQRSLSRRLDDYEPGGHHVWTELLGGSRELDSDNTPTLKEDSYGLQAGIDATVVGPWRLGVSGGYRQAKIKGPDVYAGEAEIKSQTYVTAYTTGAWGHWRAHFGAGLSNAKIETRRSVSLADVVADDLTAAYDGTVLNAFGELSYRIPMARLEVEPFVGGTFIRSETDKVHEEGRAANSAAALTIVGDQNKVQFATLGVKARTSGHGPVSFDGSLGYRRGFGDLEQTGRHLLNNRVSIPIRGAQMSENAAVVEVGTLWRVTESVTANLGYSGVIGDEGADHNVGLGVSLRF
jgi:uncharacterized protein with beta-barrel porin domain